MLSGWLGQLSALLVGSSVKCAALLVLAAAIDWLNWVLLFISGRPCTATVSVWRRPAIRALRHRTEGEVRREGSFDNFRETKLDEESLDREILSLTMLPPALNPRWTPDQWPYMPNCTTTRSLRDRAKLYRFETQQLVVGSQTDEQGEHDLPSSQSWNVGHSRRLQTWAEEGVLWCCQRSPSCFYARLAFCMGSPVPFEFQGNDDAGMAREEGVGQEPLRQALLEAHQRLLRAQTLFTASVRLTLFSALVVFFVGVLSLNASRFEEGDSSLEYAAWVQLVLVLTKLLASKLPRPTRCCPRRK